MLFNTFGINWKEENWLQFLPRYAERILRSSLWLFSKIIYNILFWLHHVITTVICHEILGVMVKSLNCQTYLDNSVLFVYSSFLWFRNLYYINANLQIYQYIYIYIYNSRAPQYTETEFFLFIFLKEWGSSFSWLTKNHRPSTSFLVWRTFSTASRNFYPLTRYHQWNLLIRGFGL